MSPNDMNRMLQRRKSLSVLALLLFSICSLACGGSNGPAGPVITYDASLLVEGNKIVFEGSGNGGTESFQWSYRRAGDDAFTPMGALDGQGRIPVVFAEPGDYAVRLTTPEGSSIVELSVAEREIDLSTFQVPDHALGAFAFTRSGDDYTVSLKFGEDVLALFRGEHAADYLYFDVLLQDLSGNTLDPLASYSASGPAVSVSTQLASLAGIEAHAVPDVIAYAPLSADVVKRIGHVEHLVMYMTDTADGQPLEDPVLDIEYFAATFFLVVPDDPPAEFHVVY